MEGVVELFLACNSDQFWLIEAEKNFFEHFWALTRWLEGLEKLA